MANRTTHDMQHMSRQIKEISGIVKIVGAASAANNVVTMEKGGHGVRTVARTGVGEITLTLDDKWVECHGAFVTFEVHAGDARQGSLKSQDVVSAKTVLLLSTDEALVAADTPNTKTDRFHFCLKLKNSTVR